MNSRSHFVTFFCLNSRLISYLYSNIPGAKLANSISLNEVSQKYLECATRR